ncbi:DNA-directed RNA polymerase [Salibacterium halotolerans]|uniref:DNA-directed RNA polymerase n=2 Tax=Salibacterium halotolerans TaxID=1884432 RepID=A0A1I5L036_9BACI|nr:DNA-directed RNA polymerase [Salibacterium halotolerans]
MMNQALGISFEEVAEDFTPLVTGMIKRLRIYKNQEEFMQVGFIALWKAYERFDETKNVPFSSYAYITVKGEMQEQLRKDSVHEERYTPSDFEHTPEPPAPDTASLFLELDSLRPYLDRLTLREQDWVLEYSIHGRGIKEIAARFCVSPHTVKDWRRSALKKLRK